MIFGPRETSSTACAPLHPRAVSPAVRHGPRIAARHDHAYSVGDPRLGRSAGRPPDEPAAGRDGTHARRIDGAARRAGGRLRQFRTELSARRHGVAGTRGQDLHLFPCRRDHAYRHARHASPSRSASTCSANSASARCRQAASPSGRSQPIRANKRVACPTFSVTAFRATPLDSSCGAATNCRRPAARAAAFYPAAREGRPSKHR